MWPSGHKQQEQHANAYPPASLLVERCSISVMRWHWSASPAAAQSRPPSRPSATVAIHQIQVALIGSGMLGGGTLNYRGATYRFRLEGLGSAGLEYRVLTPQEASPTCAAWLISRVFTVNSAAGGLLETRAGAHSGCKMQTASICAGRCTPRAITDDGSGWRPHSVREVSRYRQTNDAQHAWTGLRALRTSAGSKRSLAAA